MSGASPAFLSAKLRQAEREIYVNFGHHASVEKKAKSLFKFGKHTSLGTSKATVWETGADEDNETYVTTNAIDTISSTDAGDTQDVVIEGHTVAGTGTDSRFTFVIQTATLSGQGKVTLDTPVARVSRAYNAGSVAFAGDVLIYEDAAISGGKPSDTTKIHLTVKGTNGETQSFKAATTFSNLDYAIVTGGYAAVQKKTTASVDFVMEVRLAGGVFRPSGGRIALNSAGQSTYQISFDPYVIVPRNSDIRICAIASTTNVEVDASFQAYLAAVQGEAP